MKHLRWPLFALPLAAAFALHTGPARAVDRWLSPRMPSVVGLGAPPQGRLVRAQRPNTVHASAPTQHGEPYTTASSVAFDPADEEDPRPKFKMNPAQFDSFEGYYELESDAILTIRRIGSSFLAEIPGGGGLLYAQDPVTFFARRATNLCPREGVVEGRMLVFPYFCEPGRAMAIRFVTDSSGKATELVLYQDGQERHAPRLDYDTAARLSIAAQKHVVKHRHAPGTDDALRLMLTSIQAGAPDYAATSPGMAAVIRKQAAAASAEMQKWGKFKELHFWTVSREGADLYLAVFENVHAVCAIKPLDANGKVVDQTCRHGPDDIQSSF